MFEMSLADLDAELAVELPEREVMQRIRISHSFNHNNLSSVNVFAASKAFNIDSEDSSASASTSVSVSVTQSQ